MADEQPVAWTGSGSMMALKDGREGFIWPTAAEAHPIPLYTRPSTPPAVSDYSEQALELVEEVARVLAVADGINICSDASYRHSSYGIRARAIIPIITRREQQAAEAMREALSIFTKCAIPADTSIDPRGYTWCEAYLDQALPIGMVALSTSSTKEKPYGANAS